jgi:phage terminase large subunit
MTNEVSVRFGRKYKPLFVKAKTRYKVIYGGRASAKSFAVASALLLRTYEDDYNILFTRWTMDSAKDSVIPEFKDKMERMGVEGHFSEWKTSVQNRSTGGKVLFRGLKQGSKNQVAKMKSLFGIKIWVLDEAQELIDETIFDTIDNSIRDANTINEVWLVLNPTDIGHWIYRRFFIEAGVPDGFSGVKDNVEYIYTTYLDNLKNLDEGFIAKAEKLKESNPEKYGNIYLGNWLIRKAGIIYKRWEQIAPEEYPVHLDQWYGNDWGYGGDPNALIRMCFDAVTQTIYLWEVACVQMLTTDVAKVLKEDAQKIGYEPENCLVYCDPARPDNIALLRRSGVSAVKAVNRDKSGRISYLQGFKVKYVGENIHKEVRAYSWQPHPQDMERFTDKPQDGNDHCMDAVSYGAVTHLRRMHIMNEDGEE